MTLGRCSLALLVLAAFVDESSAQLKFRQWWKAVKNTPSCVRYIQQYSWTWLPSQNDDCNGKVCDFPKEICMSFSAEPREQQCQKVLPACYNDAAVYFCPGRHQEFIECGPANPKSCETPVPPVNSTCVPGCYCRDPWILVRSQKSVCVRKDHCNYFVDLPGTSRQGRTALQQNSWDSPPKRLSSRTPRARPISREGTGSLERAPQLPRPAASEEDGFSARPLSGVNGRGPSAWKETSVTSVPLFGARGGGAPKDSGEEAALGSSEDPDAKCVSGGTEYPLGAEIVEREASWAGSSAEWPYQVVRACATNAVGVPTWASVGCLDGADRRIELSQSFLDPTLDFLMKCSGKTEDPLGIRVAATSCVYQNDTFFPNGSAWTVQNIVRKCQLSPDGPGSKILKMGCVDDFGDAVPAGSEFRTKDGLHMRRCLGPSNGEDWRTPIVACIDSSQNRRRCDQDYSIYARLKLAGYAKKLCRLCTSYNVRDERVN